MWSHLFLILRADHPFLDQEKTKELITNMIIEKIQILRIKTGTIFVPELFITKKIAVRGFLLRMVMKGTSMNWKNALESLIPYTNYKEKNIYVPDIAENLTAGSVRTSFIEKIGGIDFNLGALKKKANNKQFVQKLLIDERNELYEEMIKSDTPHIVNENLNTFECKYKFEELLSFPLAVGINLTTTCNMQCKFCSYHPKHLKQKSTLTLVQFKAMKWLKYVSRISLFAGIGES